MKAQILGFLLIAGAFLAHAEGEIQTKVREYDRDHDGQPDCRVETTLRGKSKVMDRLSFRNKAGVWTSSRSLFVKGKLVMTESDDDGDGWFESFVVVLPGTQEVELFHRSKDDSITPASEAELASYKKSVAAVEEFWDDFYSREDLTEAEAIKLLEKAQRKIRGAARGGNKPR